MIECDPTANDDVLKVAVPLVSETLPKDVVPSMKVTLPVGIPAPGEAAETVAVKVTDCPNTEGFAAAVTLLVVAALLTTCVKAGLDVLPPKFAAPP